jgi:hypothetical protein
MYYPDICLEGLRVVLMTPRVMVSGLIFESWTPEYEA